MLFKGKPVKKTFLKISTYPTGEGQNPLFGTISMFFFTLPNLEQKLTPIDNSSKMCRIVYPVEISDGSAAVTKIMFLYILPGFQLAGFFHKI